MGSSKNDVDPSLIHLFRHGDKKFSIGRTDGLPSCLARWFVEDSEDVEAVYYSIPVSTLRDRLELRGYTIANCRRAFDLALAREVSEAEQWSTTAQAHASAFSERAELLRSMSVDVWTEALLKIRSSGIEPNEYGRFDRPNQDPLLAYMLSEDWYGLPGYDRNVGLRLALEVVPDAESFIYDVTDLVLSECFGRDEDIVDYDLQVSVNEYSSRSRIIVLTEGKTDSWVLSEALALLYPHLSDYFSFLDFDGSRTAGGVGNLVNLVKAFSGAGIVNRMVAVFDNDTAAAAALRTISALKLPNHIAILRLPHMDFLESYPTLGPTGVVHTDINGLATSIELLLGRDVLEDKEYGLVPIQWVGYEQGLRQYQGEVMNKVQVQDRFRAKLLKARNEPDPRSTGDWTGLTKLLEAIFSAFHQMDEEGISKFADQGP